MKLHIPLVAVSWALLAVGVSAADNPDPKAPRPQLVKLVSTSADGFGGFGGFGGGGRNERNPWVVVAPIEAGKPTRLPVPEAYAKRLEPFANNRGQLVYVTVAPVQINGATVEAVTEVARYDGDAAIALPGVFQFDGLTVAADGKSATVKLSKSGPARTMPVVVRPAAAGSPPQPDAAVVARLQKLKAGDLVEAALTSGKSPTLVDAYPYTQPTTGEFVRLMPLKSGPNKQGMVLLMGKELKVYALPTPATGPGVSTQTNAAIAAVNTLSKRLKPGNGVSLWLHDATENSAAAPSATPATGPADPPLAGVIRDMRYAGRVELTGEKSIDVHSTYVRVEIDEGRGGGFGRFGGGGGGIDVDYNVQDASADRAALFRGIERILQSVDDALKLNIVFEQADALNTAIKPTRSRRPTGQEQAAWITAQKAYLAATTEDARRKVEQDMILAAQELSLRIRQDYVSAETAARSILKPGQADGLIKLGEEDRGGGGFPGFGPPGFGRDRDRNRNDPNNPGQNNPGQNNPGQNNPGQNQQNGQN